MQNMGIPYKKETNESWREWYVLFPLCLRSTGSHTSLTITPLNIFTSLCMTESRSIHISNYKASISQLKKDTSSTSFSCLSSVISDISPLESLISSVLFLSFFEKGQFSITIPSVQVLRRQSSQLVTYLESLS